MPLDDLLRMALIAMGALAGAYATGRLAGRKLEIGKQFDSAIQAINEMASIRHELLQLQEEHSALIERTRRAVRSDVWLVAATGVPVDALLYEIERPDGSRALAVYQHESGTWHTLTAVSVPATVAFYRAIPRTETSPPKHVVLHEG